MWSGAVISCVAILAVSGAPASDDVILKLDPGLRYQYIQDTDEQIHLTDMWMSVSDLAATARFDPDRQIVYHLFTRDNPEVSQPLLMGSDGLLGMTNYDPRRRTIVLLHGWRVGVNAAMNALLVPAFLQAENVNVIVVDWSSGAGDLNYANAVTNTYSAARSIARFIDWLNQSTGASPSFYHIVGHSLGAHQAGMVGRYVSGNIAYITALESALPGFITNDNRLRASDASYTEGIHTNAGTLGFLTPLCHVNFYPNGGSRMPGCDSQDCHHARSYFYFAETLTSGGFTGRRCASYVTAATGNCMLPGSLRMGGLVPKTGSSGVYHLETNASPPFSRG